MVRIQEKIHYYVHHVGISITSIIIRYYSNTDCISIHLFGVGVTKLIPLPNNKMHVKKVS